MQLVLFGVLKVEENIQVYIVLIERQWSFADLGCFALYSIHAFVPLLWSGYFSKKVDPCESEQPDLARSERRLISIPSITVLTHAQDRAVISAKTRGRETSPHCDGAGPDIRRRTSQASDVGSGFWSASRGFIALFFPENKLYSFASL
jgi:hypothetical protein